MPSRTIMDRLKDGELLLMDGGTGSEIQRRGVTVNKGSNNEQFGVWSASANIDAPGVVRAIHEDYLRAGADIIISNNFYTTSEKLKTIGAEDDWEEYTRRGGELAVDTRDNVNPEAYVGGGVSPPGSGDLRSQLEDQARVLAAAGVDFLLPELRGRQRTPRRRHRRLRDRRRGVRHRRPARLPRHLQPGEKRNDVRRRVDARPRQGPQRRFPSKASS